MDKVRLLATAWKLIQIANKVRIELRKDAHSPRNASISDRALHAPRPDMIESVETGRNESDGNEGVGARREDGERLNPVVETLRNIRLQ